MAKREPKPYLLLVEGNDDAHVMYALMQHHEVPDAFDVEDCKGITPLLQSIPAHLALRKRVGIIVDADQKLTQRWNEISEALKASGYRDLPKGPDPNGTIIRSEGKAIVGIWLMPNNALPGKLEDFIGFLVPPGNTLWHTAVSTVSQVPACPEKFLPKDEQKALVHTWLAWQTDPGIPMGYAITRKYLDATVPEVEHFLKWIKALFL